MSFQDPQWSYTWLANAGFSESPCIHIGGPTANPNDQDTAMPFPWTKGIQPKRRAPDELAVVGMTGDPIETFPRAKCIRSNGRDATATISSFPWFLQLAAPCEPLGCIHFDVPKTGISAGSVLKHSQRVMNSIFSKHDPCIFKIGFSHDPAWRWTNRIYGYKWAIDGWTNMVVFHVSNEPGSAAMLEAALIDKYIGAPART